MKTVTIDLAEEVVEDLEGYAALVRRPTSELMREAIESCRARKVAPVKHKSVVDHPVFDLGPMLRPFRPNDDLLEEMLNAKE